MSIGSARAAALLVACAALAAACSDAPEVAPRGPLATRVDRASAAAGVPADLVLAIAVVEGGLALPARRVASRDELVAVAGILELRHGATDTLALGAALAGATEDELVADTDRATEVGIALLARLGRERAARVEAPGSWFDAVATMSGHRDRAARDDYATRVMGVLRRGGAFAARDGEVVVVRPHPEVPLGLVLRAPPLGALGAPEFAGATFLDTSCTGKCNTTRTRAIDAIVIHDTEGGWDASVATLQNDPGKSVHYLVDADGGRVAQFVPESYDAWHAGNSCWNNRSIGIEHVGFASQPFAAGLYATSVALVSDILSRHPVALDRGHIVGHDQVPNPNTLGQCAAACRAGASSCESSNDYGGASHHTDPGVHWQWCEYLEWLGGACDCADAYTHFNCTTDGREAWRCPAGNVEKLSCPAGCTVMPIGVDDVCASAPGGDAGLDAADAATDVGAPDAGSDVETDDATPAPDAPAADAGEQPEASSRDGAEHDAAPLEPPAQAGADASGGCALGAGARAPAPVSLVAWLVVVGAWRRRRRSAG